MTTKVDDSGQHVLIEGTRVSFKYGDTVVGYIGGEPNWYNLKIPANFSSFQVNYGSSNPTQIVATLDRDGLVFEDVNTGLGQWSYTPEGIKVNGENFRKMAFVTNDDRTLYLLGHW